MKALEVPADPRTAGFTSFAIPLVESCQEKKEFQHSQLRLHLSSSLRQLVHVEVKDDAALQAEEGPAAIALLEDRLCFEFSRLAEKHQQLPIQVPGESVGEC